MSYARMVLAALGATVVYFVLGGLLFAMSPLRKEFERYPAVYRSPDDMKSVWPIGIAGMVIAMMALAVLYALLYRGGSGLAEGARFGALIGAFAVGGFVLHTMVHAGLPPDYVERIR